MATSFPAKQTESEQMLARHSPKPDKRVGVGAGCIDPSLGVLGFPRTPLPQDDSFGGSRGLKTPAGNGFAPFGATVLAHSRYL